MSTSGMVRSSDESRLVQEKGLWTSIGSRCLNIERWTAELIDSGIVDIKKCGQVCDLQLNDWLSGLLLGSEEHD